MVGIVAKRMALSAADRHDLHHTPKGSGTATTRPQPSRRSHSARRAVGAPQTAPSAKLLNTFDQMLGTLINIKI